MQHARKPAAEYLLEDEQGRLIAVQNAEFGTKVEKELQERYRSLPRDKREVVMRGDVLVEVGPTIHRVYGFAADEIAGN